MKHPLTLSGLSFLNTRPKHQAHELTTLIESRGGHVIHFPIFEIQSISFAPLNFNQFDFCIFLSANAVNNFFQQIQPHSFLPKYIIAIGPATQAALQKYKITGIIIPKEFNSEGILKLFALQNIMHQKILIICGENSKSLLPSTLTQRGAQVNALICYRRVFFFHDMHIEFPTLLQADIHWVISTSFDSLSGLIQQFEHTVHFNWLKQKKISVINAHMKKYAELMGFQQIIQANDPTPVAILAAIEKNKLLSAQQMC